MNVYTPKEFEVLMRACEEPHPDRDDAEEWHIEMDTRMCYLLKALGYGKGVDVFLKSHKWYA